MNARHFAVQYSAVFVSEVYSKKRVPTFDTPLDLYIVLLHLNTNFIYKLPCNTHSGTDMTTIFDKFLSYFKYSLIFSTWNITTFSCIQ